VISDGEPVSGPPAPERTTTNTNYERELQMPKVDPETGEPMSDEPEGPEDSAGGEAVDSTDGRDPGDSFAGSAS